MRTTRSVSQLVVALLSLSPVVSAWSSWPRWLPELDSLIVRRDDSSSSSHTSATPTGNPTSTPTNSGKHTPPSATSVNLNTGGITKSKTGSATETGTRSGGSDSDSSEPTHTEFNPVDPAGNVVMVTPALTDGTQLYKIDEPVTWVWNYTSLQGTPTAIDVLVSCSVATRTWTLTQNMTFATQAAFTWDTSQYAENELLTERYTLVIYDAESSISAPPEAGYLSPFTGFTFGMYQKRPYQDLGEWKCATCSGAMSGMDNRAVGAAMVMSIATVLSFTWFVAGFGALL
ncbi:hypothetical protein B0T26DRAFT_674684 [Lasiosphaeria miniovina]|uniref:DUF7137 domain-containing protein n=1 Tax=Lasiosphaeria miniovina TaxID=1954250 RepID=A0AA40AW52_9PEZI|nr:uncharacterized protein B0T26DRAFT_674684 [Lasiosphaeria miniovina]KAK0723069.1 hypothetical protein B0T26DRAFT_674684 [Lasiosphaeria miniovina]